MILKKLRGIYHVDLPYEKHRETYIKLVRDLEVELNSMADEKDISDLRLHELQQKLDSLDRRYQDDEKIGTAKYKLYELQAFLHYYNGQNSQALDFINYAIEVKGSTYPKAEKLKSALSQNEGDTTPASSNPQNITKKEKRAKLIGLEGWLALFVVGQFGSLIITLISLFSTGFLSTSDQDALNQYQGGLGDTLSALTAFENIMIVIYIALVVATLVMLFKHRKVAKVLAITSLIFAACYGILDYSIASSVFNASNLSQNAELQTFMNKYSGDVGRNVMAAAVWVPYFLVSKRVKATLTK